MATRACRPASSISPAFFGDRAWDSRYDVFGNGKTAIRGGAAILYNPRLSKWGNMVNNPPAVLTPITYYGDMRTFLQTSGVLSPSNTQGFNINNKTPDNYNITLGRAAGHGPSHPGGRFLSPASRPAHSANPADQHGSRTARISCRVIPAA